MKWISRVAPMVLLLAAASVPAPAFAKADIGIAAFGGYETYSMSDLNDEIDFVNLLLAGTGYSMDNISHGFGYGGGLRIAPSPKILISLDYMRLPASSEFSAFGSSLEISAPGNSWTGNVTYFFPTTSKAKFGLQGGIGYYSGSASIDTSGTATSDEFSGSGVGFQGLAVLDALLSPTVHVEVAAGYRYAKTGGLEDQDGAKVYNLNGDEATLDWSGFMSRVGLAFYFGKK